jgi:hypothetical protein
MDISFIKANVFAIALPIISIIILHGTVHAHSKITSMEVVIVIHAISDV